MAAGDIKVVYTSPQDLLAAGSFDAITSGSGISNGNMHTSAVIDLTALGYLDLALWFKLYVNSASGLGNIHVYAAETLASTDAYEDGLTANTAYTGASNYLANSHHLGTLYAQNVSPYYGYGTLRVAHKFNNACPRKMLLVLRNDSGVALPASPNHAIAYRGIYRNVATS